MNNLDSKLEDLKSDFVTQFEEIIQKTKKENEKVEDYNNPDLNFGNVVMKCVGETRKELPFSLTVDKLNELLPISRTKIYKLLRNGTIPAKKVDGKWIIPRDNFLTWYYVNKLN